MVRSVAVADPIVSSGRRDQVRQAVFSICASEAAAIALMDAAESVPGAEFIGQFQDYLTAGKRPQFPDVLMDAASSVSFIDCDRDPELALQSMERLRQIFPHKLKLVGLTRRSSAEFLLRAMRAGCDDMIQSALDSKTLAEVLLRFQKESVTAAVPGGSDGKIIAFYGVKGGVGTTTLAVHLAMHLVKKHQKRVLLIDHKHELGHVALHLGVKESIYYFDELVRHADRLDSELLNGFVTRHSSGIELIPSPNSCMKTPKVSPDAIASVMRYLRTRYHFILIDSSLDYIETFPMLASACDEMALVCTPDVAALRDLGRRVEHLSSMSGLSEKLRVIVNRSTSEDAVTASDIAAAIRAPVAQLIPNDYAALQRAINSGEPISPQTRCPFTQAMARWSGELADAESTSLTTSTVKRRSLFGIRIPA
jgi:pilus assembly protein CpaE